MSLSSFCVVTNALRLNFLLSFYDTSRDGHSKKKRSDQHVYDQINQEPINHQEEKAMTKTMKIEGMMCGHCKAHVEKALAELTGVTSAQGGSGKENRSGSIIRGRAGRCSEKRRGAGRLYGNRHCSKVKRS